MIRVGVVSHTVPVPPRLLGERLNGVDRLLHCGGLGSEQSVQRLTEIAPLSAVIGDIDYLPFGDRFPETAEIELGGCRLFLTHMIGSAPDYLPPVRQRLDNDPPDLLVHGHAAEPLVEWRGGTLFVNPGHAQPRQGRTGSCVLLELEGPGRISASVLTLG